MSAALLLVVAALWFTGHLGPSGQVRSLFVAHVVSHLRAERLSLTPPHPPASPPQALQVVRITAPDQSGVLINQSAVVDQHNDLVTFSVTSPANQTSTVLFDVKHVCGGAVNGGHVGGGV